MRKVIFIILGTFSLILGAIGLFIPGLPTTPFLLLAAALYVRGSKKLYDRLISSKYIGPRIELYQRKKGMEVQTKIISIALMWVMIGVSVHFFIQALYLKYIIVSIGIIGTVVMGCIISTVRGK